MDGNVTVGSETGPTGRPRLRIELLIFTERQFSFVVRSPHNNVDGQAEQSGIKIWFCQQMEKPYLRLENFQFVAHIAQHGLHEKRFSDNSGI